MLALVQQLKLRLLSNILIAGEGILFTRPQFASADFSKSDGEGTFLRRKSSTDDLVGVFAGVSRWGKVREKQKGILFLHLSFSFIKNFFIIFR